ncbi:unknown [Sinorhizobium phage PBC5]|uniref:C4-dicarboxylate ABC transporter substrate-binding protein n=1 Tax=Sinorhizobium phage PBC5 TaxID=179237 RepID=UPI000009BAAA|nr:C4-dicarboxylate ABC transporter substrate-binding protein [Sinorhizobium phage PBC5]AAL49585.1 unknown [Sinorhizobium phage PBC5]
MRAMFIASAALAAMLLTSPAAAGQSIRLCTGAESGVYFAAGDAIAKMAGRSIEVINVATEGTIDSLDRLLDLPADDPNACDAMIGQPDGPVFVSRSSPAKVKKLRQVASLHREYLHVLCGANSGVDDLGDLESDPGKYSIAIGEPGSGAWLIWQNITSADEDYAKVPVRNEGGILALSAVSSGEATCMVVPAGLKNGTVVEADQTYGDTVILAGANDRNFDDAADIKGEPLYENREIPDGTYPAALQAGWFSGRTTITWNAAVFVNTDRIDSKTLPAFVQVTARAAAGIKAEYGK